MSDKVNLLVDDQPVSVPKGTVIVEAARRLGIQIPIFCYHPKLEPVAMCRMCLVEVGTPARDRATGELQRDEEGNPVIRWFPKLMTACSTPVSEGMQVHTATERVQAAWKATLEFLLTSHPLDCPVCDKGGECPLQDLTLAHGSDMSRFYKSDKHHFRKPVPLGDRITLDRERCIYCARCVRFCDEIAGDSVLTFYGRGRDQEIATFSDPPFDSKFSGNTTDICPVGALTSHDFRFSARVWELTNIASVCPYCPVGCNIGLAVRSNAIKRVMPRQNEAVNEIWICDKGRFGHHFVGSPKRLRRPLVRRNGRLVETTWKEALSWTAQRLREIRDESGPDALGGLTGAHVSNEDAYLFQKFFRAVVGTNNVDHRPLATGRAEDEMLVAELGAGAGTDLTAVGPGTTILVLGSNVEEQQPVLYLRLKQAAERGATLIVVGTLPGKLDRYAAHTLRCHPDSEAWLLWSLIRVIVGERLDNVDFLDRQVEGATSFRTASRSFSLNQALELTGLEETAVREAARAFAQSEHGLIFYDGDFVSKRSNPSLTEALRSLILVTGHVGEPGSGLVALWPQANAQGVADMGLLPSLFPGYRPIGDTPAREWLGQVWGAELSADPGLSLRQMMAGTQEDRFKALWVVAGDPAAAGYGETLTKLDFLIVQDLFLTETAKQADVVFPAAAFAEREGTFTNLKRRVQRFARAVTPPGTARPDWWIVQAVARLFGAGWSYDGPAAILEEIAQVVPPYTDVSFERLGTRLPQLATTSESHHTYMGTCLENGGWVGQPWDNEAGTPDRRFKLRWVRPWVIQKSQNGVLDLIHSRTLFDSGTRIAQSEIVRPLIPKPYALLNPRDAARLGIAAGEVADLPVPGRTISLPVLLDAAVPEGTVVVPENLGPQGGGD
ncbi:MAG: NADH-quinone oxidoreductase subunit NuoG [Chloroflexi bacterium]|nr:NADH-quinone oxidoreductase subunit NuoG [Chloroflexota bacterium]